MKDQLTKYLTFIEETQTHWVFRCPFCGDSKTPTHGHLGVSKTAPVFRCVRCGEGGHLRILLDFIEAKDVVIPEFLDAGSKCKRLARKHTPFFKLKDPIEPYVETYLKKRLNWDGDIPEELNVISVSDAHAIIKRSPYYQNNTPLEAQTVNFLSLDKRMIIARSIKKDGFFRYWNYPLVNGRDCYGVNNTRKMTKYRKHKTIVIAEGIFDIINQYLHRFVDTPDDAVYLAALNMAYSETFKKARGLALTYKPNVVLLADDGVDDAFYMNKFQNKYNSIRIYRNKAGKDFGDFPVEAYLSYSEGV